MQEYIQELQEKAGLTEEQATKAMEVLVAKIKSKVPVAFHGIIDNLFADKEKKESSSFQDKYKDFSEEINENFKKFSRQAREELNDVADKAEDFASDIQKKSDEAIRELGDKLSDLFGKKTPPPPKND